MAMDIDMDMEKNVYKTEQQLVTWKQKRPSSMAPNRKDQHTGNVFLLNSKSRRHISRINKSKTALWLVLL